MYDTLWEVRQHLARLSDGSGDPLTVLIDEAGAGMLADPTSYRLFFDLLPHLLENPRMAHQLAELYRAYRDMNVKGFMGEANGQVPEIVEDVAALTVALIDGLAVQVLAEPNAVDVRRALDVWKRFLESILAPTLEPDAAAPADD